MIIIYDNIDEDNDFSRTRLGYGIYTGESGGGTIVNSVWNIGGGGL